MTQSRHSVAIREISRRTLPVESQTKFENKWTKNPLMNTNASNNNKVNVQRINKKLCMRVSLGVFVSIVLIVNLVRIYNFTIEDSERKKKDKELEFQKQSDKGKPNEYYMKGLFIKDTSNKDKDERIEHTKIEIKAAEKQKLDEDKSDQKENTEENDTRKKSYIEELKPVLLTLISNEFKKFNEFIQKQCYVDVNRQIFNSPENADSLEKIKNMLCKGQVPTTLEGLPIPTYPLVDSAVKYLTKDEEVKMNNELYNKFLGIVEKYLTATEVLSLKNSTSSAKSFVDYLQSLKPNKKKEYTEQLNALNTDINEVYKANEKSLYAKISIDQRNDMEEMYSRVWTEYPKGEVDKLDRHLIKGNSGGDFYTLTADNIVKSAACDYFRCEYYFEKYKSINEES